MASALEARLTLELSGNRAQARLFTRAGTCFAITPKHVLKGERYAALVVPTLQGSARHAQGDLCVVWPDLDLALLEVSGLPPAACGDPLSVAVPVQHLLPADGKGSLRFTTEDGSKSWLDVQVTFRHESGPMKVRGSGLGAGLSGSTIYLSNRPAAILLKVGIDDAAEGEMLPLETIYRALQAMFEGKDPAVRLDPSCADDRRSARDAVAGSEVDYAAAANGGKVVSWSVPSISSAHRPDILLAPPEAGGYWAVEAAERVALVVRLAERAVISRIDIDLRNVSASLIPSKILLFTRGATDGPWTQVAGPKHLAAGSVLDLRFAPRMVVEILIKCSPDRSSRVTGISRIHVIGQPLP